MTSKSKVFDLIKVNIKKMESDWTESLENINVWNDVYELYTIQRPDKKTISQLEGNTILAFIIFAYHKDSEYLEIHKDRFDNKVKIMQRFAGPNPLVNEVLNDAVYGFGDILNRVINWYIDYQKDWRWKEAIVQREYASKMMAKAATTDDDDISKQLTAANLMNIAADKTIEILQTEFLNLDTALEKENRPKATDLAASNFMSHEAFIRTRNKKREQLSAEDSK